MKSSVYSADLWLLVKSRDVPLHHPLHAVVGVLFDRSAENEIKSSTYARVELTLFHSVGRSSICCCAILSMSLPSFFKYPQTNFTEQRFSVYILIYILIFWFSECMCCSYKAQSVTQLKNGQPVWSIRSFQLDQ